MVKKEGIVKGKEKFDDSFEMADETPEEKKRWFPLWLKILIGLLAVVFIIGWILS